MALCTLLTIVNVAPDTGEKIEPEDPQKWGLQTGSKQIKELKPKPPATPNMESGDKTKGWGFSLK